jgi:hypothetical protein
MVKTDNQEVILEETNSLFMDWFPDTIGCFGTIIVLLAYILLQTRKLNSHSLLFSFLNLIGGLMMLVSLLYCWNLAAVAMEISWVTISGFGMVKVLFPHGIKRRKRIFEKRSA